MGVSCSRPVPEIDAPAKEKVPVLEPEKKEVKRNMILVGKPAPKFKAPAFYKGNFTSVSLTEYIGKWVLLCFYPGDFTFV